MEAYKELINTAKNAIIFINHNYNTIDMKSPGFYEDYLILKNKEYSAYRQTIEEKTVNNFPGLAEKKKYAEAPRYEAPEFQKKKNKNISYTPGLKSELYEDRSIVPYLVLFPVIFLAFLASDLGVFNGKTTTSGSGTTNTGSSRSSNGFFYWGSGGGGSSWSSGGGGSSISKSSSTSSSSIIKSFGGGGFSKGGGG